jgi:hypothetical protein
LASNVMTILPMVTRSSCKATCLPMHPTVARLYPVPRPLEATKRTEWTNHAARHIVSSVLSFLLMGNPQGKEGRPVESLFLLWLEPTVRPECVWGGRKISRVARERVIWRANRHAGRYELSADYGSRRFTFHTAGNGREQAQCFVDNGIQQWGAIELGDGQWLGFEEHI